MSPIMVQAGTTINRVNLLFTVTMALRILASYEAKIAKNLQLLDIQTCNSANKPFFKNLTNSLFAQRSVDVKSAVTLLSKSMERWAKRLFVGF